MVFEALGPNTSVGIGISYYDGQALGSVKV